MGTGKFLRMALGVLLVGAVALSATLGASAAELPAGAVYTLTNDASGNAVLVYPRAADGTLAAPLSFATGGLGTGAGLGSQGAVVLSAGGRRLFAVNAGSDDVSVFAVQPDGLALLDREPSRGDRPVSLTVHGNLLYVLNAGAAGNIAGFTVAPDGTLAPLAGSERTLSNGGSGDAPGPAQVQFSPDGSVLVVTEKATNLIDTYAVQADGRTAGPAVYASAGSTPFGFDFGTHNTLIVSDAFGGAPDASALSSYRVDAQGLEVVTALAPTTETAACWVVVTGSGLYAYTTNAGSASISGYAVDNEGRLTLLDADGRTGVTGGSESHPTDMALSAGSGFLYALDAAAQNLVAFRVLPDGHLAPIAGASVLPTAAGLAAR